MGLKNLEVIVKEDHADGDGW